MPPPTAIILTLDAILLVGMGLTLGLVVGLLAGIIIGRGR